MFKSFFRLQWIVLVPGSHQGLDSQTDALLARMLKLFIAMSCALIFCSCAQSVNITHSKIDTSQGSKNDIFDTRVVVQWAPATEKTEHTSAGLVAVGLHNRWDIDFASTTPHAVADVLRQYFANVSIQEGYSNHCSGCGMIVRPKIRDFGCNNISMQAKIELDIEVYDAYGEFVHSFAHKGKSPITSLSRVGAMTAGYFVPFSSTVLGKPVVNATVKSALDDALEDIEQRFATESQTGGKLARVWRPRKESYGEHEYVAEQIAKNMGCNLHTDGIHLVESEYGREVYDAYCFEPGRFTISCELGRCDADINSEKSIAVQAESPLDDVMN